ncbi:PorP/SprF family type IX secretion system membrane protein [Confluentibacter citreus]|uniref:PorP/SprF family type IX secretion system membrane protein n=1 Tax=Confluentibacter citreus TaxID=2007307 RepID=UPI001EFD5F25|nr:PorP/SprF family type IX secretion system membrane protein [Confluentibacter citreus]
MILFLSIVQQSNSQEDGVVALALPVRNSLKFNKYVINPTFSFVREQNKHVTFTNKREWMQFDNAPQTYLFSYSGRFSENSGIGVGLFQQNYGVLTTFGGVFNYAYNVVLDRDSNLTFGMNLGAYKSGINEGNVVTNFPDPSLQNIPSNTVITVNPGINYGMAFFDVGVSLNNLASYNFTTSRLIEDNPEQSVQAHVMYTGYVNSRGFFDETKFSGLVRSEFKKDQTVISGIAMFTVPKGFWAQAGYNTLFGLSGGVGFNVSSQIALEYNYEKAIGDLSMFGSSHEITLAYKFKNRYRYNYSGDDDEGALITPVKKSRTVAAKRTPTTRTVRNTNVNAVPEVQSESTEETRIKLEQEQAQAKAAEEAQIKLEQQQAQARADEETRIKLEEEQAQAKAAEEAQIKLEQQQTQAKVDEEARLKLEQEQTQAKAAEEAQIKLEQQQAQAKSAEEARLKLEQEQAQAKADEEARIKLEQEQAQVKADEEARIKLEQEALQNEVKEEVNDSIGQVDLDDVVVEAQGKNKTNETEKVSPLTADSSIEQHELLIKLRETVARKEQDLKDLKEENDLSEQGIYSEPKPFKSVSAENAALESLKIDIENVIKAQNAKIRQMEDLYNKNANADDSMKASYLSRINALKAEQLQAVITKDNLLTTLEGIKEATEIERKRRIKRAAFDSEQDRYLKDRAALNVIKQNTTLSTVPIEENDFDFGEERSDNIQILKGVSNVESGYYAVLAVHSDVAKRDEFLTKVVASGQNDINFFYDVNTSKYFIYYQKFETIEAANNALKTKDNKPYNSKMSMIKIEN